MKSSWLGTLDGVQGVWSSTDHLALGTIEFGDRSDLGETKLSEV